MALGNPGCPLCGKAENHPVVVRNGLEVVRCSSCGHRYVSPVPSEEQLARIYDRSYYNGGHGSLGFSDYEALAPARQRMFARHLDRIERIIKPGRVLDVGCATGDFLKLARDRGWEALGVDPSPARELALSAGLRLVGRTIDEAAVEPGSISLVTFWDVLEHLPDPVVALKQAARLLSSDGLIAATVPDAGNAVARLTGRRWFGYKTAGEHLQFFSPLGLRQMFAAADLEVQLSAPVEWSCTVGFLVDRAALYLGPPGRLAKTLFGASRSARIVVDVPQVNQFAIARRAGARVLGKRSA